MMAVRSGYSSGLRSIGWLSAASFSIGASVVLAGLTPAIAQQDEVGSVQSPIVGGTTATRVRPKVGSIGGCTATLIAPRWALSAAHCFGHRSVEYRDPGPDFVIEAIDRDGTVRAQAFPIARVFSLGYPIGPDDIALMHLSEAVPLDVAAPARMVNVKPSEGSTATVMGYGCTDATALSGAGTKRMATVTLGYNDFGVLTSETAICPGDSGGPVFLGASPDPRRLTGPIAGVNSQLTSESVYADVFERREEIAAIMSAWNAAPHDDIWSIRWCRGEGLVRYDADVNGDRAPDLLCHDLSEGSISVAVNDDTLLRHAFSFDGPFCTHDGAKLMVGDFNGDGRSDILCNDMNDGRRWLAYADEQVSSAYYSGSPTARFTIGFCTHESARLHAGDFNGDGRTDLLCHDSESGYTRITFAGRDAAQPFDGDPDWWEDRAWCVHDGARVYASDFNGDGYSDLLCHSRPSGAIDFRLGSADGLQAQAWWGQHQAQFSTEGQWKLRIADYNGDGRADLVCESDEEGLIETIGAIGDTRAFEVAPIDQRAHWSRRNGASRGSAELRLWRIGENAAAAQPPLAY